ncbi:MAG: bifunctional 23S rRNA (guanine(2069)-N(7))-methyltransferase RlmK/23S rRNA (guanine(2445)-N(2))-methyltransferase RlmL, partial [Desulfofustis sp.]|nr:bifunctional 23S rRNA (guanine(2069)-N(7))-methyltransferase RlmK/23S rRNA (guanine(2445)-N(2))-methyltransferase RlmL [Desulfofustis sp.]
MDNKQTMRFIATCAGGLESLVQEEITGWGGTEVATDVGAVEWSGTVESGYRACLWSRFSSRILLVVDRFEITSTDDLYERARLVPWEDHLAVDGRFAVDCALSAEAPVRHSKFAALRIKDALVDRFRERNGVRPDVQPRRPDVRFAAHIRGTGATLAVDLSGESLHRRGYRVTGGIAPLKESLAAAIIAMSGWTGEDRLIDPLCGSGTLLIEAALLFADSAPGLDRSYFGLTKWLGHQDQLWQSLIEEAVEREQTGRDRLWPPIIGYDADEKMIVAARENIARAGMEDKIVVERQDLSQLQAEGSAGWLVCNPPYGERLSEKDQLRPLYRFLGNRFRDAFGGWQLALFTAVPEFADLLQIPWHETRRLYNGPLPCGLFLGRVSEVENVFRWQVAPADDLVIGRDLVDRLKKNLAKRLSWASEQKLECFRVYDRDLPDYNVIIELYRKWIYIREFSSAGAIDSDKAEQRWTTIVATVRALFSVGRDRLFLHRPARKSKQGGPADKRTKKPVKRFEVSEAGAYHLLDFAAAGGPGLPLDQRSVRRRVRCAARGLSFVNILDQVGAATVHAVLGGASRTTTVVADSEHQERVSEIFALNGIYPQRHRIVVDDMFAWLERDKSVYDLAFINIRS